MKILIVDDREEDRYLLGTILKNAGHQSTHAANGAEALDILQHEPADVIISDILMPEMDGYMLCRRIKSDEGLKHIPFFFLTATYLSDADEIFARQLGAERFMRKPYDPNEIITILNNLNHAAFRDTPEAETIEDEDSFSLRHTQHILQALEKKSNELEALLVRYQQTEVALRASEERYRLISSISSDYFYTLKADAGGRINFAWIGGAFERITGFHPENISTLEDWMDLIVIEDRDLFEKAFNEEFSSPAKELEYRIRNQAGDIVWLMDCSRPMPNGGEPELLRVGAVKDITRQKTAEVHLNRLATAVESAAESILITDADGVIQYVNPAFEQITGYGSGEVMDQNPRILKSGKHGQRFYQSLWRTIQAGQPWRGLIVNKKKDGVLYETETTISPIRNNTGRITHFVAVQRDMTRERSLEKQVIQSQKMEAIGTLAGGIAHDFNNILSVIIGFSELCLDDADTESILHSNLQQILDAGQRARDLVHQILTFARQTEQESKPVQLGLLVKEAMKMMRAGLPAFIRVESDISNNTMVLGDASQLHQVLMNLCTNAAHAMHPDGGVLTVQLKKVEVDHSFVLQYPNVKTGPHVVLTVGDTGCGMSPDMLKRIFDPFYTTKEKGEGTGLGLAVVHGIVESHGGTVHVYSEPGAGSTFKVFLPAVELRKTPEAPMQQTIPHGSERILFLDDEPAIVNAASQILQSLGYEVTSSTSSEEALKLFADAPNYYDIVITDMTMPRMTGVRLAQNLMEIRPDIPIILCTGFTDLIDTAKSRAMGIRAMVTKPLLKHELAQTIRAVMNEC